MKRKSLLRSILSSAIGVLACVVIVVCVVYSTSVNIKLFATVKSDFYHVVSTEAAEMDAWLTKHEVIAENLALTARVKNLRGEELKSYLNECILNVSDGIMDCYVAWEDEAPAIQCAVFVPDDDFIPQERGWYKEAVAAKDTVITSPYIDASTGKIVITVVSPIMDNGSVVGCCGIDIDLTQLVDLTGSIKADEKGYAVLIDADNNVVVHTKNDEYSHRLNGASEAVTALTDISPIYSDVLASVGGSEIIAVNDYDGVKRFYPIAEIGDSGWKIMYAADYNESVTIVIIFSVLVTVLGVLGMVIGGLFLYFKFTKRIKPLISIENIVMEMAEGKLEHEYPKAVNDEVGVICSALESTNTALKTYIGEIHRRLSDMADGNFTDNAMVEFVGEFTEIDASIKNICTALRETFSQIEAAAEQISDGSRGVATGATALANAVSDETALVNEVMDNVENIAGQVKNAAENAASAKAQTVKSADVVGESSRKMEELLEAMNDIASSAEEIVKINATIEDIAFQTNILALNASIEAARAGEAGKGFAVVADEVRNLANKSGEASNTTNNLIANTVEVIGRGKELANEAAALLSEVVEEAGIIESSVTKISDASETQKERLSEIVTKLSSISDVVQTTAATAEESAAASEELDGQVVMLKDNLSKYKI